MAGKRQFKPMDDALDAARNAADGLDQLDAIRELRELAEVKERELVAAARKEGYSWTEIGALYGMTKQGAQQRFRSDKAPRP